jgi:hypothetical protein
VGDDSASVHLLSRLCVRKFLTKEIIAVYRIWSIGQVTALLTVGLVYILIFVNTIRLFLLCTYTEPGVIPKIRSSKIDYN